MASAETTIFMNWPPDGYSDIHRDLPTRPSPRRFRLHLCRSFPTQIVRVQVTPTELLQSWRGVGSREAFDQLTAMLYDELQRIARGAMRHEQPGHTLQTNALLHEAYVRLIDANVDWQDRAHFLAVAARTMRRVLVDHGKARLRAKRGGGAVLVTLTGSIPVAADAPAPVDVLVLSDA